MPPERSTGAFREISVSPLLTVFTSSGLGLGTGDGVGFFTTSLPTTAESEGFEPPCGFVTFGGVFFEDLSDTFLGPAFLRAFWAMFLLPATTVFFCSTTFFVSFFTLDFGADFVTLGASAFLVLLTVLEATAGDFFTTVFVVFFADEDFATGFFAEEAFSATAVFLVFLSVAFLSEEDFLLVNCFFALIFLKYNKLYLWQWPK